MAGSNGHFPGNLPILDGKNYEKWCIQMKAIFGFQEVLEVVKNGVQEFGDDPSETQKSTYRDAKKKDCKAMFFIHQCVDPANFEKIISASSAKEAWDILEKSYAGADKVKKVRLQTLRRQYELLQMEGQESVAEYLFRLKYRNKRQAY